MELFSTKNLLVVVLTFGFFTEKWLSDVVVVYNITYMHPCMIDGTLLVVNNRASLGKQEGPTGLYSGSCIHFFFSLVSAYSFRGFGWVRA